MGFNCKIKNIIIIVFGVAVPTLLCSAIFYALGEQWFKFGLCLTGYLLVAICFAFLNLYFRIDASFNELKKLLRSHSDKEQEMSGKK